MKHRDLAALYRKLSAAFGAGVAPGEALAAIAVDPGGAAFKEGLMRAAQAAWGGASLSAALAECKRDIPEYHRSMIVQGETTGQLDVLFRGLAVIAEKDAELRDRVKRELFMPKVTLTCALPFVLILLPGFGAPIAASILAIALLGAFALVLIAEQMALRLDGRAGPWMQPIIAQTPYFGRLATTIATIRFARAAAALYRAGVVFSRAIEIAADACGSTKLRKQVRPAVQRLERGTSATEALADTGIFPPSFAAAFRTGDATGNADKLLESVADFCDQDVAVALHQFSVIIGVAALLIVGVLVGLIVTTFYGAMKG